MVTALEQPQVPPTAPSKGQLLLSRLSRITTAGRNVIPQIDGLRFIAIMAVVAYHVQGACLFHFGLDPAAGAASGGWVGKVFTSGHCGVHLFFAISGFILSLPFARQSLCQEQGLSLREYYLRRVTRIEPPYVIHLAFLLVMCAVVYRRLPSHPHLYQDPAWAGYALTHLLASLVYANGFIFGQHPYPNVALWSLEVEVQFYLLAPFLAKVFLIRRPEYRRALLVGAIVVGALSGLAGGHYRVWASLAGNLQFFLVGFLLTDLYVSRQLAVPVGRFGWDIAALVSCGAVICAEGRPGMMFVLPSAIFVCGLAAFRGAVLPRFLASPWIATIGGMCYTIYLYHMVLIGCLIRVTARLRTHILSVDLLLQFVVMALVITAICAVLFAYLERPFMRRNWPARLWEKVGLTKRV